jgi:hypothetical protein
MAKEKKLLAGLFSRRVKDIDKQLDKLESGKPAKSKKKKKKA